MANYTQVINGLLILRRIGGEATAGTAQLVDAGLEGRKFITALGPKPELLAEAGELTTMLHNGWRWNESLLCWEIR